MKLLKAMIVMLIIGNAHAFQLTHIQSSLQDYGKSTGIFAGHLNSQKNDYNLLVLAFELPSQVTEEKLGYSAPMVPTEAELATDIEFLKNAHEGSTRTIGLNSLFQVSDDTLIQINTQFNSGFNSDGMRVVPSLKIGFTFAKQLDEDNSFILTLSPKLVLGGNVFRKSMKFADSKRLGKVSNGTTVSIEWTHKF